MMTDKECCANCRHAYALEEWDYSGRGCAHTPLGGFVCMAFADERKVCWMVGLDANEGRCEAYEKRGMWMKVTHHYEAERTCFTCANAFVNDNDCIVCAIDGRSRDDDQTCDEWS